MSLSTGFGSTTTLDNRIVVGNSLAVGSMVFWAAGFPAADALLQIWHPVTLILLRLLCVLCLLYPLWIWLEGRGVLQQVAWRRGLNIGFFGFGIGTALLLFAQWYTDPVTVALIATTTPIMATLIEVWQGDRRITLHFVIGLTASVIGGVFAVGDTFTLDTGIGLLMAILAGAFFAWASDASVKQLPALSTMGRTTVTFSGAALFAGVLFVCCRTAQHPFIRRCGQFGDLCDCSNGHFANHVPGRRVKNRHCSDLSSHQYSALLRDDVCCAFGWCLECSSCLWRGHGCHWCDHRTKK
jgi:drug/metabolite transporter (DMT)-like permease